MNIYYNNLDNYTNMSIDVVTEDFPEFINYQMPTESVNRIRSSD